MSEKRFTWKTEKLQHLDHEVIMVVDNANKDWKGHVLNIVDKLNELTEENERLQKEIRQYWEYKNKKKQKIKDLEKQLNHIQNLIYKDKMQRLEDE